MPILQMRSEGRRVGKECRSRWRSDDYPEKGRLHEGLAEPEKGGLELDRWLNDCEETAWVASRAVSTGRRRSALVAFFFQAEDGIRDRTVTGVQTCALPICRRRVCRAPPGPCAS